MRALASWESIGVAELPSSKERFAFQPGASIWVHTDGWAGHLRHKAVLVKVNAKRSRVRYAEGHEALAPNYAITERLTP